VSARMPLYEQIYTFIFDAVRQGRLRTGDRVPSEKELAEQFNVSRITSKRALEELESAGVVRRRRGYGTFVSDVLPDLERIERERTSLTDTSIGEIHQPEQDELPRLIGFIVPDFSEVFGMRMLYALEDAAAAHNCHLILRRTHGQRHIEQQAINSLVRSGVDGIVVFPVHGEYYNADLLRLVLDRFPLVLVDRYLKGIPASAVTTDNRRAAAELTRHLLSRGYERVAFISPPVENTSTIEERLQGFVDACHAHGVTAEHLVTSLISTLPAVMHDGAAANDEQTLTTLFEQHDIQAVVACEYNLAVLAEQVVQTRGSSVEIVCFDAPTNVHQMPRFTYVQQDERRIGEVAMEVLLNQLNGNAVPDHRIIDYRIIER
jgi:GntR family transcriptional regulator, arabinose operon transcriptional repressor